MIQYGSQGKINQHESQRNPALYRDFFEEFSPGFPNDWKRRFDRSQDSSRSRPNLFHAIWTYQQWQLRPNEWWEKNIPGFYYLPEPDRDSFLIGYFYLVKDFTGATLAFRQIFFLLCEEEFCRCDFHPFVLFRSPLLQTTWENSLPGRLPYLTGVHELSAVPDLPEEINSALNPYLAELNASGQLLLTYRFAQARSVYNAFEAIFSALTPAQRQRTSFITYAPQKASLFSIIGYIPEKRDPIGNTTKQDIAPEDWSAFKNYPGPLAEEEAGLGYRPYFFCDSRPQRYLKIEATQFLPQKQNLAEKEQSKAVASGVRSEPVPNNRDLPAPQRIPISGQPAKSDPQKEPVRLVDFDPVAGFSLVLLWNALIGRKIFASARVKKVPQSGSGAGWCQEICDRLKLYLLQRTSEKVEYTELP